MTHFIRTNKSLVNVDHIVSIWLRDANSEGSVFSIKTIDDEVHYYTTRLNYDIDEFEYRFEINNNFIAATPGFFVLAFNLATNDEVYYSRGAIIGWRIEDTFSRPITIDGIKKNEDFAILSPDGSVEVPFWCSLKNIDEFEEWLKTEGKKDLIKQREARFAKMNKEAQKAS